MRLRRHTTDRHTRECGYPVPRLIGSITAASGILGRPVKPGDDTKYDSAISRRATPELLTTNSAQRKEGAGNAGCLLHPRSRVQKCAKKTHTSIQVQSEHSDIPRAMVLRLMPCSPRRRIRLATVADGLKVCLNPVGSTPLRQLDTSNGCQDHTVLPYAASPVVCAARIRSRTKAHPANTTTRPTLPRPPHPAPTFVTMANAPLPGRDGGFIEVIWGDREQEYFH
jgi:hypothetical protein